MYLADALTVMIRVFVGTEGVIRGGRSDRSSERGDLGADELLDDRDWRGDGRSEGRIVLCGGFEWWERRREETSCGGVVAFAIAGAVC